MSRYGDNAYFSSQYCDYCGTVAYDENAWRNHACTPYQMQQREEKNRSLNMATVMICDRCGAIATAKVVGQLVYEANPDADAERMALCPQCSREVYDCLHMANKDVRTMLAPFNPDEERATDAGMPTQADTSRAAITVEYGESPYPPGAQGQTRY